MSSSASKTAELLHNHGKKILKAGDLPGMEEFVEGHATQNEAANDPLN